MDYNDENEIIELKFDNNLEKNRKKQIKNKRNIKNKKSKGTIFIIIIFLLILAIICIILIIFNNILKNERYNYEEIIKGLDEKQKILIQNIGK